MKELEKMNYRVGYRKVTRLFCVGSLLIAPCSINSAQAADLARKNSQPYHIEKNRFKGFFGFGVRHESNWEGSSDKHTFISPDFSITYKERIFLNTTDHLALDLSSDRKPQLGVYVINNSGLKLGVAATYESDFNKEGEPSIFGANTIDAADLRLFASYSINDFILSARYSHVINGTKSQLMSVGALHKFKIRPKTYISVFGSATWANKNAMNARFDPVLSVDDGFGGTLTARASDLIEFEGGTAKRPKAGLKSVEAGFELEVPLDRSVFFKFGASASYLTDNAQDTPTVDTDWVAGGNASIIYKF